MKIKVSQLPAHQVPHTGVTNRYGAPIRIVGIAPDWLCDGKRVQQTLVEVWSPLTGWKQQTVLESSLIYENKNLN